MEAMGPPFYKSYFGWTKKENGLVFMMVALCAILGYGFMKYVSAEVPASGILQQMSDRFPVEYLSKPIRLYHS